MALQTLAPSCARRMTASTSWSRPVYSKFGTGDAVCDWPIVAPVAGAGREAATAPTAGGTGTGEPGGVIVCVASGGAAMRGMGVLGLIRGRPGRVDWLTAAPGPCVDRVWVDRDRMGRGSVPSVAPAIID